VASAQQDVVGLHVAVDDALAMGVLEGVRHLAGDSKRIGYGELPLSLKSPAKALALDVGHGEPELTVGFARVVHGQDMRVLQSRGRADLAQEPLGAQAQCQVREEDLERDGPVVAEVAGEVDHGHAAAPELSLESVPLPQRVLKAVARLGVGHGERRMGGSRLGMGSKLSGRRGGGHGHRDPYRSVSTVVLHRSPSRSPMVK
jgi:hypothetical protein